MGMVRLPGGRFHLFTGEHPAHDRVGVKIVEHASMSDQKKAPSDGVQELDGKRFRVRKGDALMAGATFAGADDEATAKPAKRPRRAAKKASAGPTETTEAAGPTETDEG
jgi:hypothetical protein